MFLINALATLLAFSFIFLVYIWLKGRKMQAAWGDIRRGMLLSGIRYAILRLEKEEQAKSWRPNILVLSGSPTKRWRLIELANALTQENALFTVSTILPEESVPQEKVKDYEKQIEDYLYNRGVQALVRVIRAPDPFSGSIQLVNAYGLVPCCLIRSCWEILKK